MSGCETEERLYRRNATLKKLKQMLCKLENVGYEKGETVEPTVFIRRERCECRPDSPPPGTTRIERQNLDGGEAFPFYKKPLIARTWTPEYPCPNQQLSPEMGCYRAVNMCRDDQCMCCECEVGEGSHMHLPSRRDCTKPLQSQCFASDLCTEADESGARGFNCDSYVNPGRWFPNVNSTCVYPRACPAQCMDHPDLRDWVLSKPTYTYYLQDRHYQIF